ncbi:MAG TPA: hypothetical protein VIH86_15805 [Puia sp.]
MHNLTSTAAKFLFAALFIFLLDNCNKTQFQPNAKQATDGLLSTSKINPKPLVIDTIAVIKNSANGYDYVGAYHNDGVAYDMPLVISHGGTITDSLILADAMPVFNSIGITTAVADSEYNLLLRLGYAPLANMLDIDTVTNKEYAQHYLSLVGKNYAQQMETIANTYLNVSNDSTISGDSAAYVSYANAMISLETTIIANHFLMASEKNTLLISAAIGRYSASYWANAKIRGTYFAIHLPKWLKIAIADVAGGVSSFVQGAGSWPGAIVGAVTSSVKAAL